MEILEPVGADGYFHGGSFRRKSNKPRSDAEPYKAFATKFFTKVAWNKVRRDVGMSHLVWYGQLFILKPWCD